jgi:uncharacterized protein (TIGR03435 family)
MMAAAYRDSATGYELDVFGGPDWMESARYDVQAKADCSGGIISRDQQALMVQSFLEDRFQLKTHIEIREMPVYNLVVGKDGSKLKASSDQTPAAPQLTPGSQLCGPTPVKMPTATMPAFPAPGTDPSKFLSQLPRGGIYIMPSPEGPMLQGGGVAIARFVDTLKRLTGRQVIDKTGLAGLFDIKLKFSIEGLALLQPPPGAVNETPAAADPAPTLFTAIQDLGLKLEPARGPVQVVVIDSVQKPSEN